MNLPTPPSTEMDDHSQPASTTPAAHSVKTAKSDETIATPIATDNPAAAPLDPTPSIDDADDSNNNPTGSNETPAAKPVNDEENKDEEKAVKRPKKN